MKVCARCGVEKPLSEFYKVKYKGKEPVNTYTICKTCTSIEQRRRYLMQVDPTNPMIGKIEQLYEKHRAAGRSVPGTNRRSSSKIDEEILNMLEEE